MTENTNDDLESATPQSLDAYEYDEGDVFQEMGGHYWTVTARLWNFDAKKLERMGPGEAYEVTENHDRREYELTRLDPDSLGMEKQRFSEIEIYQYMNPATAEEAREYYQQEEEPDP